MHILCLLTYVKVHSAFQCRLKCTFCVFQLRWKCKFWTVISGIILYNYVQLYNSVQGIAVAVAVAVAEVP